MSTQLMNAAGDVVGVRFHGGDRGPMAQVLMPRSIAELCKFMPVHEEATPDLVGQLGMWILDMEHEGRTVIYGTDVVGEVRQRQLAAA